MVLPVKCFYCEAAAVGNVQFALGGTEQPCTSITFAIVSSVGHGQTFI